MAIIAILNPKGGSGKTTVATNLACNLYKRGFATLLVDSDPQGSARDWQAANENNPIPIVAMDRPNNFSSLKGIAKPYTFVVIDGAAKLENVIAAAIKQADLILIPVQPSPLDLWATADLVDLIQVRQEITDGHPGAAFVISRAVKTTRMANELTTALESFPFPVIGAPIAQRQIYPQMAAAGLSVLSSRNKDAIAEIDQLTDDVFQILCEEDA